MSVTLVAQVGNTLDLFLAHKLGNFGDHCRLIHLIGNLRDDNLLTVILAKLNLGLGAHDDRAASFEQRLT